MVCSIGKDIFNKGNIPRDNKFLGSQIINPITLLMKRVPKEYVGVAAFIELISSDVVMNIGETPENT